MSESLRQIKLRIKSIENTEKVVHAMQMISAAKMRRFDALYNSFHPYYLKLESMLKDIFASDTAIANPFLETRPGVKRLALCVIASDTGLCGNYNEVILTRAREFIDSHGADKVELIAVGRKAHNYFKRLGIRTLHAYEDMTLRDTNRLSEDLAAKLTGLFLLKTVDEVYIIYTHPQSLVRRKAIVEKFLNISREAPVHGSPTTYICEPDAERLIGKLIPAYISAKMKFILIEAFRSEHAARMVAMQTATDNAEDLVDTLTLQRNKARQTMITKEMLEISSAAEALKG